MLNSFESLQNLGLTVKLQQSKSPSEERLAVVPVNTNMLILYPNDSHSRGMLTCSLASCSVSPGHTHRHFPTLLHLGNRAMWCGSVRQRWRGAPVTEEWVRSPSPLLSSSACSLNRTGQGLRGLRNGQAI